jgi:hypothetical protein
LVPAPGMPFDALHMNDKGIPVVDRRSAPLRHLRSYLPRMIIGLVDVNKEVHILCRSYDKPCSAQVLQDWMHRLPGVREGVPQKAIAMTGAPWPRSTTRCATTAASA